MRQTYEMFITALTLFIENPEKEFVIEDVYRELSDTPDPDALEETLTSLLTSMKNAQPKWLLHRWDTKPNGKRGFIFWFNPESTEQAEKLIEEFKKEYT